MRREEGGPLRVNATGTRQSGWLVFQATCDSPSELAMQLKKSRQTGYFLRQPPALGIPLFASRRACGAMCVVRICKCANSMRRGGKLSIIFLSKKRERRIFNTQLLGKAHG
jgi:hypothetical protein